MKTIFAFIGAVFVACVVLDALEIGHFYWLYSAQAYECIPSERAEHKGIARAVNRVASIITTAWEKYDAK